MKSPASQSIREFPPPMDGWPLWRKALWFPVWMVYAPLLVLAIPVLLVGIPLAQWWCATSAFRRLRSNMAEAGRVISWDQIELDLSRGPGTVVWEATTLGWPILLVWWMPEPLSRAGGPPPPPEPDRFPPEDVRYHRWLWNRVAAPTSGTGRLVGAAFTNRSCGRLEARVRQLRAAHPAIEEATLWSAVLSAPLIQGTGIAPEPGAPPRTPLAD